MLGAKLSFMKVNVHAISSNRRSQLKVIIDKQSWVRDGNSAVNRGSVLGLFSDGCCR